MRSTFSQLWPSVAPITLLHEYKARLVHDTLLASPLDGDAVECGVFRGGIVVMMAKMLAGTGRRVVAYDSFLGLPPETCRSSVETLHYRPGHMIHSEGAFRAELDRHEVARFVDVVPGWFSETMRGTYSRPLSFVHVDCDMYHGVKTCVRHLYDKLAVGGVMVFDDYFDQGGGVEAAVNELVKETCDVLHAGYTDQVFVVKGQTWRRHPGEPAFMEPRCGLVLTTSSGIPIEAQVPIGDHAYLTDLRAGKLTGELPGGTLDNARRVALRLLAQCDFHDQVISRSVS